MNQIDIKRLLLRQAYSRCASAQVAFIDESYVLEDIARNGETFYIATAYVSPIGSHKDIREDLMEIVGGNYWHTTEAHQQEHRRPVIDELCRYIGDGGVDESVLVAVKSPISPGDADGEIARSQCLTELLGALHSGSFCAPVALAILEERRHLKQKNRDEAIVKAARRAELIGQMQVLPTSPSIEPLLWVPDVVSFAQNHKERGSGFSYFDHCAHKIQRIDL